jgi:hypothetical protein
MTTNIQDHGNIPAVRVTFYADNKKPELSLSADQRASFLRYKTDKKLDVLRASMAVILNKITRHQVSQEAQGSDFVDALIAEKQDELLKRCADKELDFASVESAEFLVKDYFDTTRTASGKKLTADTLGAYFDGKMMAAVVERIVAKFPQFEASKIEAVTKQYRQLWCDLSKYGLPHTKQGTELVAKLVAMHSFAEEETELAEWAAKRVKSLQDKHNAAEMMIDAI